MDEDEQIIDVPFTIEDLEGRDNEYRTYRMDFENKRIAGMIDGVDAVVQSIWKILSTRRFAYAIYDDQYGSDIFDKIGNENLTPDFFNSDIIAMVEDALSVDERILSVDDFKFNIIDHDSLSIAFVASTIYGDIEIEGVIANDD